jgi:hypothetical protein
MRAAKGNPEAASSLAIYNYQEALMAYYFI